MHDTQTMVVPLASVRYAVTGHLVIALRVSFSAPLAVLGNTIASETCLASNAEKLTVPVNIKLKEY